jgi:3-hydroxyisobutyrate dehydrogenase-like beta-hydroxyacid dehydrogenase
MVTVAHLGLGLMGTPMATHLVNKGFNVHVYNRTQSKVDDLIKKLDTDNITNAKTPCDAVRAAEKYVITMMFDLVSLENTILNDTLVLDALKGKTIIQCQTIGAEESIILKTKLNQHGIDFIECPVLGHNKIAEAAKLQVLIGATVNQMQDPVVTEIFSAWGTPKYIGESPKAIQLKLSMNHLVLSLTSCFSNSLSMVEQSGINPEIYMDCANNSMFHFKYMDIKYPRFRDGNYAEPNWSTDGARKDAGLILKEVQRLGVYDGIMKGVDELMEKTVEKVGGDLDMSAMHRVNNPNK